MGRQQQQRDMKGRAESKNKATPEIYNNLGRKYTYRAGLSSYRLEFLVAEDAGRLHITGSEEKRAQLFRT